MRPDYTRDHTSRAVWGVFYLQPLENSARVFEKHSACPRHVENRRLPIPCIVLPNVYKKKKPKASVDQNDVETNSGYVFSTSCFEFRQNLWISWHFSWLVQSLQQSSGILTQSMPVSSKNNSKSLITSHVPIRGNVKITITKPGNRRPWATTASSSYLRYKLRRAVWGQSMV